MRTTCPSLRDCLHESERCVWTSNGCIPGPSSCHTQLGVSDFDSIARCFWYWRSGDMKELHMTLVGVKSISKNNAFPILVLVIHRDMCWSFYDIDGTAICLKFPRVWISRLDSMNWRSSPQSWRGGWNFWLGWVLCRQALLPCIAASQCHAKGSHAFWRPNQYCKMMKEYEGYISHKIPFPLHPFARGWRVFQKISTSIQILSNLAI